MHQKLNSLDLGISRLLEHNLVLVWKTKPELEQFRAAAQALLLQWPVLGARLDILRANLLFPDKNDRAQDLWKGKTSDRRVAEAVGLSHQGHIKLVDPTFLEGLVDFGYGISWTLRQDVLAIRAVILDDGSAIGFKLQHPFGDAN
ncbi:hypothetical protein FALBO_15801, partial [Fusarium albosuccineum]